MKNPENLRPEERTRLLDLLRLNAPIVKAYLLKEDLRRFWDYRSTAWATSHLRQWLWRASHSRLEPFHQFAKMLRTHLAGVLTWTRVRVTIHGVLNNTAQFPQCIIGSIPDHMLFGHRID